MGDKMPRWLRWVLGIVVVLAIVLGGAYWWFLVEGSPPQSLTAMAIDMAKVRALADEMPGPKAEDIRFEAVSTMSFPRTAVVAGDGWDALPMGVYSYQLLFPDGTMVIDSALDEAGAKTLGATFHPDAYQRMDEAMAAADQVILTHEHPDHIGGVIAFPEPEVLKARLKLNPQQLASAGRYMGFTTPVPPVLDGLTAVDYADYLAIAPGVVLIRAPGHTPGSQMVFVKRADGRELLFVGDIGWSLKNIAEVRPRARAISQFMLGEDREAVFSELKGLQGLMQSDPAVRLVPGHDAGTIAALVADGLMEEGFEVAP